MTRGYETARRIHESGNAVRRSRLFDPAIGGIVDESHPHYRAYESAVAAGAARWCRENRVNFIDD